LWWPSQNVGSAPLARARASFNLRQQLFLFSVGGSLRQPTWRKRTNLGPDGVNEQLFGVAEQIRHSRQSDYGDVASGFPMEGTMQAPMPLPTQAAITIMGCLLVFVAALWLFVITKAMIAIGVGELALLIAGVCAFAHRLALKPV
jgi:hypothetical protein